VDFHNSKEKPRLGFVVVVVVSFHAFGNLNLSGISSES